MLSRRPLCVRVVQVDVVPFPSRSQVISDIIADGGLGITEQDASMADPATHEMGMAPEEEDDDFDF